MWFEKVAYVYSCIGAIINPNRDGLGESALNGLYHLVRNLKTFNFLEPIIAVDQRIFQAVL